MSRKDFIKIMEKGFNKTKYKYKDARNGESEIFCFKCKSQAGLYYKNSKSSVKCLKGHNFSLIKYTLYFTEMINDLTICRINEKCELKADV